MRGADVGDASPGRSVEMIAEHADAHEAHYAAVLAGAERGHRSPNLTGEIVVPFREDFLWGVATAAYQIEGGARQDGRGDSVWDMVCRRDGFVKRRDTGAVACDHYNRMPQDVELLAELGVNAYRFSIAWPRVLPNGTGAANEKGLAFYDRLVDALLARSITPLVTLFHWDYPTALFNRGGWLNRESVGWFADYTRLLVDRLSDRVSHWLTLNEPQCFIGLGHENGGHAPGIKLPFDEVLLAAHHTLLAHGAATRVIREHAKTPPSIGWAPVGCVSFPDTESEADVEAARRATFGSAATFTEAGRSGIFNWSWWSEPVLAGAYPEDFLREYGDMAPTPEPGDMELIAEPIDVLGFNLYHGRRVRAGADGSPEDVAPPIGEERTPMNWPITPPAIYWALRFYHERYAKPMIITENGRGVSEVVSEDGLVHDPQRIDYLARYLKQVRRATEEGIDVRGYCCWSFMDNFEWAFGYEQRFGLVHVDYATQKRTVKDSGRWYARVARSGGVHLDAPAFDPAASASA